MAQLIFIMVQRKSFSNAAQMMSDLSGIYPIIEALCASDIFVSTCTFNSVLDELVSVYFRSL